MKMKNGKGASAVEFAIILPVLIVMLFGIIEFGLVLYDKAVITNASREGARQGTLFKTDPSDPSQHMSCPDILNKVSTVVTAYCADKVVTFKDPPGTCNTATSTCSGTDQGDELTVVVTYQYDYLVIPAFISTIAGPITINATTIMRME